MSDEQSGPAGPISLTGDTPRRDAMRTMGAAGAALLGLVGLRTAAAAEVGTEAKRNRRKRGRPGQTGPAGPTGPAGSVDVAGLMVNRRPGTPFNVTAGATASGEAGCNAGELLLGGGYSGGPLAPNCAISELDITNAGAWIVTVACSGMSSANGVTPVAFCLALES